MRYIILFALFLSFNVKAAEINCGRFVQPKPEVTIEDSFAILDNIQTWKSTSRYTDKVVELEFIRQNGLKIDLRIYQENVGDIFVTEVSLGKEVYFEEPTSGFIYRLNCN